MMANNFLGNLNPEALMAISSGLLTGRNTSEQIGGALGGFAQVRQQQRQKNTTMDWLQKNSPDLLPMLEAGMSPADLLTLSYKQKREAEQERLKAQRPNYMAVGGRVFNENTGEWISPPGGGEDGEEWGLNPVWGKDKDGNVRLGQMSKSGKFKPLDTGDFTPTPGINNIDTGTEIITRNNRSGDTISVTPKNLVETERLKAEGKGQGDAIAAYQSMNSKMPGLETVVMELEDLSDKATYTATGQLYDAGRKFIGMDPREEAIARTNYIAKVDNQILPLLRDTFGAQFTVKEGETLRSTLGDPDKSPAEKKAVLRSFIEQKRRDVEALARQSGLGSQKSNQRLRFNPATGELE